MLKEEAPRVTGRIHKTHGFEGIWRQRKACHAYKNKM